MIGFVIGTLIGFALGAWYAWLNEMPDWAYKLYRLFVPRGP
jgi:ABC-type nitrate/sulfonate/bicarbonate transport system permease component